MSESTVAALPAARVRLEGRGVRITDLYLEDEVLADFLSAYPADQRPGEMAKIIAVGVRGITSMGVGATVDGVREEMQRLLADVTSSHRDRVREVIEAGNESISGTLDPDVKSSLTAKALDEIGAAHEGLLAQLDLDRSDSHTARLVSGLGDFLGPEGALRARLDETFDTASDDSAMGRLRGLIEDHFRDLRDLIVAAGGATGEAAKGTAKGVTYENAVVAGLRRAAAEIGGCTVEATGGITGDLDPRAKVGDAVITLADGARIVVEAKNTRRITLTGKDGILDELDRAMANRDASWALAVSHEDAFPLEVGAFGIYGNRLLVVDDGDGVLVRVALRWIRAMAAADTDAAGTPDAEALRAGIERLRALAQRFSTAKRALSGVRAGIDQVRSDIDGLRSDLLDLVEDLTCALPSQTPR